MQTSRSHAHGDYPGSLQMFFAHWFSISLWALSTKCIAIWSWGSGSRSKVFDVQNRGSELGSPESTEMPGIVSEVSVTTVLEQ